jgi:hypothetical protein
MTGTYTPLDMCASVAHQRLRDGAMAAVYSRLSALPSTLMFANQSQEGLRRVMIRLARISLTSRCRGTGSEFPVLGLW